MAAPFWVRCHSCFSIRVSPAPVPSPMTVWLIASQTPDSSGEGDRVATFGGGVGLAAQPPAATANANMTESANRIRIPPGETDQVYTIKLDRRPIRHRSIG